MVITLAGERSFKIVSGGLTIATESPASDKSRLKPDIFLRARRDDAPCDAGFVAKGPGEYEVRGISITGIPPFTYLIAAEDLSVLVLSAPDHKSLEQIPAADIALVTARAADAGGVANMLRQLSPKLVIAGEAECAALKKEMGISAASADKVTVKRRDLAEGAVQLVCLTA